MARVPIIVVGAGGLGREVAWLIEEINEESPTYEFLGFVDDRATETVEGYPVLGTVGEYLARVDTRVQIVCAIGAPHIRYAIVQRLRGANLKFATLIHPSVRRSRWVEFGPGTIVCANTSLTTNVKVGAHALFNPNCAIGHDVSLNDFTSLMPGVHISGEVSVGVGTYFGVGSTVINQVSIGDWTIVGAGSVVTQNLPSRVVAVGVPAKPIKENVRVPDVLEE